MFLWKQLELESRLRDDLYTDLALVRQMKNRSEKGQQNTILGKESKSPKKLNLHHSKAFTTTVSFSDLDRSWRPDYFESILIT
jgi:hypothetical protein